MSICMKKLLFPLLLFTCMRAATQSNNSYKVIAYYTGNGQLINQYPVAKLTHIIYSFLKIQNDTLTFKNEQQQQSLQQLVQLKQQYPQLKIMVSIGGWGGCAPCSPLFASAEHRSTFAKTTVELFKKYSVDGIDLDWEYPAIEGYPGHPYEAADKQHFTELTKALRKEMGDQYLLSFAAGGFIKFLEESIEWNIVTPLIDFVNLMTYDLVSGNSTVTGHHTPLADYLPKQESTKKCVNWLLANNVPSQKLIIGAAMYGRVWEQVPNANNGLYQPAKFKHSVPYKNFSAYFTDTSGFRYYWDRRAKAPYQYNKSKQLFASFDDPRSIAAKAAFVRRNKLGGIMFWELSNDLPVKGLTEEIYQQLKN